MHHGLDQPRARLPRHLAHHAEIEIGQAAVAQGQQVAGVGIGMEETVLQQLLQAAVHPHLHHVVRVDAEGAHGIEVGELDPIDPLHRQHPAAGGLAMDGGNGDARVVAVQPGEGFGVAGLVDVIHLLEHPLAELIDEPHQIALDHAHVAVEPAGDVADDVEIQGDLLPQAGPLHLHRHPLPRLENAAVHLAEGGGGDGVLLQRSEDFVHRGSQILLDAGHRQGAVEARQLVLQLGQFLQQQGRDDVGPGGEGLARLDEGGTQGHEQFGALPRPFSGPGRGGQLAGEPVEADAQQIQADRHQGLPHPPGQARGMAGVDAGDGGRVVAEQAQPPRGSRPSRRRDRGVRASTQELGGRKPWLGSTAAAPAGETPF